MDLETHFRRDREIGFLIDPAGVVQAASVGAEHALGYGPGEFRGLNLPELDAGDGLRTFLSRPVTSRWNLDLVVRLRAKSGKVLTTRAVAAPMFGDAGDHHGWMVWAQDLVEGFDLARGGRTILDSLLDSIGAAFWSFDANGTVLTWGPACESAFGRSKAEAEGRLSAEALFPSPEEFRRVTREVDEKGRFSGESVLAGRPFHLSVTRLLSPSGGSLLGYTVVSFDLSERKRAEEFRQALFAQAGEAMVVVEFDSGRITDCNDKMCEVFGYGREELLRLRIADLAIVPDMGGLDDTVGKALREEGQFVGSRVLHRRKDGSVFPCEVNIRVMKTAGPLFTVAIIRDLTEKHRAAEFFRVLFERSSDGAYLVADEGLRVVEVNDAICGLLGYTRAEMLALTVRDITPVAFRDRIESVRQSVKVERPFERIRRGLQRKDGSVVPTDHMISRMEFGGKVYYLASARDVTAEIQTERALEESRALLEKFRDEAPDPMYILDGDGRVRYLNASGCRALGVSREEILGRAFADLTPPDRLELNREMFARAMRGETVRFRTEVIGAGGARIPIEINGGPLRVGGRPGTMGVARLISDQLRLEKELEEARSFLEHVQESAADGLILTDERGVILFANPKAAELRGMSRESMVGRHFLEFSMPGEEERYKKSFARLQAGEPIRLRTRVRTGQGVENFLDVSASSIERVGRRYVYAIIRDVTEQVRAEEGLSRYREILAHANDAVLIVDSRGIILEQNEAHRKLLGYPDEELVGKTPEVFAASYRDNMENLRARGSHRGEILNRARDGRDITVEMSLFPVRDGTGEIRCVVALKRDVTERKRAEERLQAEVAERRRAEAAARESEEKWVSLVTNAPDIIIIADREGRIQFINRVLEGFGQEKVLGMLVCDYINPEYHGVVRKTLDQVFERGEPGSYESLGAGAGGSKVWYSTRVSPIRDRGRVVAATLIGTDITERKFAEERLQAEVAERRRAEAAARESEEKWQLLVRDAPDQILTFDRAGKILFINRTLAGFKREDVLGVSVFQFVDPAYHAAARERLEKLFESGESQGMEVEGVGANFAKVWYSIRVSPILHEGKVVSGLGIVSDVTERRRSEEKIAALAEEMGLLLANARDFLYRHDAKGVFTYVSPSVEQITGYTPKEWLRHYSENMTDNPANRRVVEYTEETLRTGKQSPPYSVEVRHKDGRTLLLEVNERAVWEGGKVTGIVGVARDVTRRQRAEERAAAQHAVTQVLAETDSFQEAVPRILHALGNSLGWPAGAFWRVDGDGVLRCARMWHEPSLSVDATVLDKVALRPGEWLPGRVWAGDAPLWVSDMALEKDGARAAAMRLRTAFAFPLRGTSGILGVVELLRTETLDPDPELIRLSETLGGQISQFVERKRAEEALRFQKALLESQSEAAIDGILVVSTTGKVVSYNNRFLVMWDMPGEVVRDREETSVLNYLLGKVSDPEEFLRRVRFIEEHPEQETRDEVPLKDGRTFERYIAPVRSLDGTNYGRVLFFRDVTGRKRAEEGLRRAVEDARRAYDDLKQAQVQLIRSEKLASIGMLVSGVAHEINNPLNVIYGNLRLLEEGGAAATRVKGMLRDALKGAEHARRIVEDFRNFARDTRTAEPVDLNRCLEETLTILGRQLPPEVKVERKPGKLPPVRGFRGQLNQVFLNLVKNAAEAIEGKGKITVRTMRRKNLAVVEVADTGRGMPSDVQKKIFEPFFTTKPVGKGLGLGLSISATIVHNHGGQITVRSRVGRGTVFRVEFPIKV